MFWFMIRCYDMIWYLCCVLLCCVRGGTVRCLILDDVSTCSVFGDVDRLEGHYC